MVVAPKPVPPPPPHTEVAADAAECCASFSAWPQVKGGVTCNACTALVYTAPFGGRCDRFCESFGHVCTAAAEELADDCRVKFSARCDAEITGTSDMLCTCRLSGAAGTCSTSGPAPAPTLAPPAGSSPLPASSRIEVRGRQLLVDGRPLHLKGVAWNPVNKGSRHQDFSANAQRDADLMAQAGINAVRTYGPLTDRAVLDTFWARGIWVVNSVYNYGGDAASSVAATVDAVKDHPAILMWTIGNEWNYNGLYKGLSSRDAVSRLQEVAAVIKQHDTAHPVASIYGELTGLQDVAARLPNVDVWGINSYRGISLGGLFDDYARLVSKPMFVGEYGADAWNARVNREDAQAQADATRALTLEIVKHSSVLGGTCFGGFVFEFADEWWKDGDGSSSAHDIGGVAPGGGPYPDSTFNEEWWGLVDIDRNPRPALAALAGVSTPAVATS